MIGAARRQAQAGHMATAALQARSQTGACGISAQEKAMVSQNRRKLLFIGVPVAGIALLAGFFLFVFSWNWFLPIVERSASAALGRGVSIARLDVDLGRVAMITLHDARIANPADFPAEQPFARLGTVNLAVDLLASARQWKLVLPSAAIDDAAIHAVALADGRNNYTFKGDAGGGAAPGEASPVQRVTVTRGRAHVAHAPLAADFNIAFETRAAAADLQAEASGTYAGAPLNARFSGGALPALLDRTTPWPVHLELENGPTHASLRGTVRDLMAMDNADLTLELAGPDMRLLRPLTGVPIPQTPAFRVSGKLAYAESRFRFTEMQGQVGDSDLGGTVTIEPRGGRPDITADLTARHVDLADLAGFIGGNPGRGTPLRDDGTRSGRVLPNAPVNLPLFQGANVHARFRAARISGDASPLDDLDVTLELIDGVLTLKPLRGGVGRGAMIGNATLTPNENGDLHAVAEFDFRQLDIGRLMRALGARGGGALSGRGRLESTGRSTAQLLARGNGSLNLHTAGGNLSAFAVDIAGLRLGSAVFSAFGLPQRTQLECFVADFVLESGVLKTRAMLLETTEALLLATGTIRLDREQMDLRLRSQAKEFTVGSLPTSLAITGSFSNPSVLPVIVENRSGGSGPLDRLLDLALAPLSLIPTIELGIGDDPRCRASVERARRPAARRRNP